MTTDPSEAKSILQEWAQAGSSTLNAVEISESSLTSGSVSIASSTLIPISDGIQYSAISIVLQIRNPSQSLMAYRGACKKHAVKDIIKPSDKASVVSLFVPGHEQQAAAPAEPEDVPMPDAKDAPAKTDASRSSSKDKDKRRDHKKHRSSSSKHHDHRTSPSKKPRKSSAGVKLVTNEQLMQHLDTVVDKRSTVTEETSGVKSAIQLALSADGFGNPVANHASNENVRKIISQEIPVGNSASVLRATKNPNKNFSRVLEVYAHVTGSKSSKSSSAAASSSPAKKLKAHLRGKRPVIVVPKGTTAAITLQNAHSFLCNATYTPRRRGALGGAGKKTFTRNMPGYGLVEFEISDNPCKLGMNKKEWDRIVAVVVTGEEWQFKDWIPGYETPAQLFANTVGCYIGLEGESKQPPAISTWKVVKCLLHREKRGLDSVTYTAFWNAVDDFLKVYKPELLPNQGGE